MLDKKELERFCLEHLFDILNINEKLQIMNALLKDKRESSKEFNKLLIEITDKYIFKKGDIIGFLVTDYKKIFAGKGSPISVYVFIFDEVKKQWITDKTKIPILLPDIFKKFGDPRKNDIKTFNEKIIGFLTKKGKNKKNIVFKTKSMKPLGKKKKETGLECPSKGENRRVTLDRINNLVKALHDNDRNKYKMKDKHNRTNTIYNEEEIQSYYTPKINDKVKVKINPSYLKNKQIKKNKYYPGIISKVNDGKLKNTYNVTFEKNTIWKDQEALSIKNVKNEDIEDAENITITDIQLCVETELLLRYLDKRDSPDKRWFFSTVEDALINIKDKTLK
jgi:ribosomal protein L21E